jgi:hypothetical protein
MITYEEALAKSEESVHAEIEQRRIFGSGQLPGWDIERLFETNTVPMLLALRKKD